jgi:lipopolysaccharide/colanic/teichoic acid biosynthesis glycosyltransferase
VKRAVDVVLATAALVVLSPLFAFVALAIKRGDPGPIFYRGERIGLDGRPFQMLKFRTMVANAATLGGTSTPEDDPRLTRAGRWMRAWKVDELPQLINVVRGDMSIVGPRPQVAWAVALYSPEERALLSVRPGISDFASLRFRNEAEILRGSADPDRAYLELIAPEKIRLGLEYVRNQSLATDLAIIAATFWSVLGGQPEAILGRRRQSSQS